MSEAAETVVTLPLSAGERAGVRAGVITNCLIYFGNPLKLRIINSVRFSKHAADTNT